MEKLKNKLKEQMIKYLNLLDITPDDIKDDEPLFGGSLELDSIDSLELIILLEREYGIKINSTTEGRKVLIDINTMTDYIIEKSKR
ncbi:MAG: acyl carrier protein [Bacteroidales bacterium]|nr:acyl carrier protein [Bacteroidales bacterium]